MLQQQPSFHYLSLYPDIDLRIVLQEIQVSSAPSPFLFLQSNSAHSACTLPPFQSLLTLEIESIARKLWIFKDYFLGFSPLKVFACSRLPHFPLGNLISVLSLNLRARRPLLLFRRHQLQYLTI